MIDGPPIEAPTAHAETTWIVEERRAVQRLILDRARERYLKRPCPRPPPEHLSWIHAVRAGFAGAEAEGIAELELAAFEDVLHELGTLYQYLFQFGSVDELKNGRGVDTIVDILSNVQQRLHEALERHPRPPALQLVKDDDVVDEGPVAP
jgi:hypothetical protein